MRRPQRTEDRLRAGGEDGAYLCVSLEGWGELNQWPRAQPSGSRLGLKREHGAYSCRVLQQHGEKACSGTPRAAQQCTRRARDAGVAEQELSALAKRVRVGASGSLWLGPSSAASNREVCEATSGQQ